MDYVIITIFQAIGVFFRCGKTVSELRLKYPSMERKHVLNTLWNEDYNTLIMSFGVLWFHLATHYVISYLGGHDVMKGWDVEINSFKIQFFTVYLLGSFGGAAVLGWKGQDLFYKWLGSAADKLDKEITEKLQ